MVTPAHMPRTLAKASPAHARFERPGRPAVTFQDAGRRLAAHKSEGGTCALRVKEGDSSPGNASNRDRAIIEVHTDVARPGVGS